MGVVEYWKENLPLIIPLLVLSSLFILFIWFFICREFKKSIVASATRSLYNLTSSPNPAANQSNSTNRTSGKRSRAISDESEPGFELITSSPNNARGLRSQTPGRNSRNYRRNKMQLSAQYDLSGRNFPIGAGFESYPETSDSTFNNAEHNYVTYENEVLPVNVYRVGHQPRRSRRAMSSQSHNLRRHSSGNQRFNIRRHAVSHPSQSSSQLESQFIRFQNGESGQYPDCLRSSFTVFPTGNPLDREDTLATSAAQHSRRKQRERDLHTRMLQQLLQERNAHDGNPMDVQERFPGAGFGEVDFGLTPVMEEMGGSGTLVGGGGSGLASSTKIQEGLLVTNGSRGGRGRVETEITGQIEQKNQIKSDLMYPVRGRGGVATLTREGGGVGGGYGGSGYMNRYSTPLPPGSRPPMMAMMRRNTSKASSGLHSVATTNQSSLRTHYTDHNDLAHSISSISLNSTYLDYLGRGGDDSTHHMASIYDHSHHRALPRHCSSDSELEAMTGSRKSMSRAFNFHPIAMDTPQMTNCHNFHHVPQREQQPRLAGDDQAEVQVAELGPNERRAENNPIMQRTGNTSQQTPRRFRSATPDRNGTSEQRMGTQLVMGDQKPTFMIRGSEIAEGTVTTNETGRDESHQWV